MLASTLAICGLGYQWRPRDPSCASHANGPGPTKTSRSGSPRAELYIRGLSANSSKNGTPVLVMTKLSPLVKPNAKIKLPLKYAIQILFFLTLLALGLSIYRDYGISWD